MTRTESESELTPLCMRSNAVAGAPITWIMPEARRTNPQRTSFCLSFEALEAGPRSTVFASPRRVRVIKKSPLDFSSGLSFSSPNLVAELLDLVDADEANSIHDLLTSGTECEIEKLFRDPAWFTIRVIKRRSRVRPCFVPDGLLRRFRTLDRNDFDARELGRALKARDKALDEMNANASRRLIERMAHDPEQLRGYLNLMFIARHLERVGDHATNIAEDAVYAAAAEDIRHQVLLREG